MSIAQRSVAREGELHPAQPAPLAVPNDSAALAAFHCDSVNLPWVIFRAAFRANQMQQLPRRARAVLAALARTVDAARPFASIFARRELLMGRAMQSLRTLYRSLDDLEGAGLIERAPQSRYAEIGRFGRSNLQLTERAAALLGFVDQPVTQLSAKTAAAADPLPEAPVQAPDIEALSFTSPSAKLALGAIYKDLSPTPFQKRQPGQLPSDLQRLRSLGFIDFLIFKLMREARENGKRLSDVVEATGTTSRPPRLRSTICAPSFEARSILVTNFAIVDRFVLKNEFAWIAQATPNSSLSKAPDRLHRQHGRTEVCGRCGRSVDDRLRRR